MNRQLPLLTCDTCKQSFRTAFDYHYHLGEDGKCPDIEEFALTSTQEKIYEIMEGLETFLITKNKRYGNSAIEPLKVFSKNIANDSILTRIDDKLSRIKNSDEHRKNDIVDLLGYLVLLCVERGWDNFEDLID